MKPKTVEEWKALLYEARREYMTSEVKAEWPWPSLTDHLAEVVVKTLSIGDEALEAIE